MRPYTYVAPVLVLAMAAMPALAESSEKFDPARMWECTQADGSSIYTNKERAGCKLMALKELSVVPSLDHMPTSRPAPVSQNEIPEFAERASGMPVDVQHVPDWARQWRASVVSSGPNQAEVCSLYGEWLHLNQKTRGGFFYGSDPSYGGDLSAQNQRGASFSFYDNARFYTLTKLFGPGFVPIGCP